MSELTGRQKHELKYRRLTEHWGVKLTREKFMGLTREQMREKYAEDRHLNNVATLRRWDAASAHLVGKHNPFDSGGNRYAETPVEIRPGRWVLMGDPNRGIGRDSVLPPKLHEFGGRASVAEALCAMKYAAGVWCGVHS